MLAVTYHWRIKRGIWDWVCSWQGQISWQENGGSVLKDEQEHLMPWILWNEPLLVMLSQPCQLSLLVFPHQFLIPTRLSETLGKIFSKINFSHHLTQTIRLCDPALSTNVTTLSLFRLRFYNHPALCQGFPVLPPPVWVILWCHSPRFMMLANVVSGMTIDRTSLRPSCETSHMVFCLLPPLSSMMYWKDHVLGLLVTSKLCSFPCMTMDWKSFLHVHFLRFLQVLVNRDVWGPNSKAK